MTENRKKCPFCGEEIALAAKKCRFCGEWLDAEKAVLTAEPVDSDIMKNASVPENSDLTVRSTDGSVPANINVNGRQVPANNTSATLNQQPVNQQPIINIQLSQANNMTQQVSQEQTVIIEKSGSSNSGCLWTQLALVGGAVWAATGTWWIGVITWILLIVAVFIPYIGGAICVVLGAGMGLLAGVISAAFGAPTWVCWVIGIIIGAGAIGVNFDDRKSED